MEYTSELAGGLCRLGKGVLLVYLFLGGTAQELIKWQALIFYLLGRVGVSRGASILHHLKSFQAGRGLLTLP